MAKAIKRAAGHPEALSPEGASKNVPIQYNTSNDKLEFLDDDGVTVREVQATPYASPPTNTYGNGAKNGATVTATEYGEGILHKTVLTLASTPVVMADEAGVIGYGGLKVYDFPAGAIKVIGAIADLALLKTSAGINDAFDGDFALGTATAANDADLTSTEANIIPKTTTPQAAAGATTAKGQSTASQEVVHDGTTTAIDVFLNFLVDDTDHDITGTAANIEATGTITLYWINLGDY